MNALPEANRHRNGASLWIHFLGLAVFGLPLVTCLSVQAQWLTQSISLKAGWNAVYLHVDASYDTLNNLVGADPNNPIVEVWLWRPSPLQDFHNPQSAEAQSTQWSSWNRLANDSSGLQRLVANAAYLVRVDPAAQSYEWRLKGKPVGPNYRWTTTGLNLVGFPTPPGSVPTFKSFLAPAPDLHDNLAQLLQYVGGDLGPHNPVSVSAYTTTPVARGRAFWMDSGQFFNRYYGPIEVEFSAGTGLDFRDTLSSLSFRLGNLSTSNVTVFLELLPSEEPPAGQPASGATPSLLVRGGLEPITLTYNFSYLPVGAKSAWTLNPKGQNGSKCEVVLGLNRSAMSLAPGTYAAGILRLTDSLGLEQVEIPVLATGGSRAGLWVGAVQLTQVGEYLKTYARDNAEQPLTDTNGGYVVVGMATNLAAVPRAFPLRLVLHNPSSGNAVLLQRVYCGLDAQTNDVIATSESVLNHNYLTKARRLSCVHLPWTAANTGWNFNGNLENNTNLTTTVLLDYREQPSNPFLHTYHPDHDNLNGTFQQVLPQGSESYTVHREITLTVNPPASDFDSLTASAQNLRGNYLETITLEGLARSGGASDARQFNVRGSFSLNRISNVPALTRAP